ncbi:MAG: nickel-dependent hydrogenase large subunit [Thermoanaerobacteraceae bacterium]|nr:nickel-dependent hydrogenase large subunit [Thermoanaerobacteraceae bacterium]
MVRKRIFPVTRIHEPLSIEVEIKNGAVTDAWCSSMLYRGFEQMMYNRDPRDAIWFTQRICGICSSAHAIAACYALQDAYGVTATPNGVLLQNIIFGADIIQNHLRHLYVLVMPDYVEGPDIPPFNPKPAIDYRLPKQINDQLMKHYWEAAELSARAHQLIAIFGAKAPHQQAIYPTGVSVAPDAGKIKAAQAIQQDLYDFAANKVQEDFEIIAHYYPEYLKIGRGYGNLMSFGMFPHPDNSELQIKGGLYLDSNKKVEKLNPKYIRESVAAAWYREPVSGGKPLKETTIPQNNKPDAYSWTKAPRYQDQPVESGPLARWWINGKYRRGISAMDRLLARAFELKYVCEKVGQWLEQLRPGQPSIQPYETKKEGLGVGLTDAMRGALGHWMEIHEGRIKHYQIITPTAWNLSPRDEKNRRGPAEEALIGTPVENVKSAHEIGRVIRSFDPCLACAVHLIETDKNRRGSLVT